MNIELYIANRLCDLGESDLSIRLRRQFINPAELNTKDAQKSYSISLPSTPNNDAIFSYKNVEETDGKFTIYPDARLYVNGILVMEGKFRLSEITHNSYKGNLGVPALLTAKDIFGERKMNNNGDWSIDFLGEKSLTNCNTKPKDGEPKPCIFPLVLYRIPPSGRNGTITGYEEYKLEDFPPSVNCLKMLEHLFKSLDYNLAGSAFNDKRLKNLYVSYRNPNDFEMPYKVSQLGLSGSWTNCKSRRPELRAECKNYEAHGNIKNSFVVCNLFDSDLLNVEKPIRNPDNKSITIKDNNKVMFTVPRSGLYKITLNAKVSLLPGNQSNRIPVNNKGYIIIPTRHQYVNESGIPTGAVYFRCFYNTACELKLMRTGEGEDLSLSSIDMDASFSRNNEASKGSYPQSGKVLFIDPKQNKNLLCGFSWGRVVSDNENYQRSDSYYVINDYKNDAWRNNQYCHPMAIKHGQSWDDKEVNAADESQSVVYSPGYVNSSGNPVDKYVIDLKNSKTNTNLIFSSDRDEKPMTVPFEGTGLVEQIVYLKEGERLHLVAAQDRAENEDWIWQKIDFDINLEYFSKEEGWITENMNGETNSSNPEALNMDWLEPGIQMDGQLNLSDFLPTEVKIDDWINNFCKAFNLELIHRGDKNFELNLKKNTLDKNTSIVLNLDKKASVVQAANSSLGLPRVYKLGFTNDTDEQGYAEGLKKDSKGSITEEQTGGGTFYTGNNDAGEIEQKSNFSYCWYKKISYNGETYDVPVITDSEVWDNRTNFSEAVNKRFYQKAQRFWYATGKTINVLINKESADMAIVSNTYQGDRPLTLDYEDKPNSIMRQYFMLLDNNKSYTTVECFLTPEEYDLLDRCYVKFNGDLYLVAEADGYDPMGESKTKLKLLKKD